MIPREKAKIIFLNPPLTTQLRYGKLSQAAVVEPPLGLAFLAAVTRKAGFISSILDSSALGMSAEESVKKILKEQPDFLAITLTTLALKNCVKLAKMVKENSPKTKIIVGGCHFTSLPMETLQENPCFDLGVIGEGEATLKELLEAVSFNKPLSLVQGIALRENGKITLTSSRKRINDLDSLPFPAFDLLPRLDRFYHPTPQSIKYLPTISLITSRGCNGHCLFCDRKTFGNLIQLNSAQYIVEMLEKLQKDFGIKGVIFEDDNFFISEERLTEFSRLINKKKLKIAWTSQSRIDNISEEKLKIAKSAGCWQILYGIESGSQEILDFYKKEISLSEIKNAVYLTKKHGLSVKGFFILGGPLETERTLAQTRDLIKQLPFDDISITFFTPYPGAQASKDVSKFGEFDRDWSKFSCFEPVFVPFGLSKDAIIKAQQDNLKNFYAQPRIIWSYLSRLNSLKQLKFFYRSWRSLASYTDNKLETRIILNADDFGLCEGINRGVALALETGTLNSVSLLANGYAFNSALEIIKKNPGLKVGIHLTFLSAEKKFSAFFGDYLLGRIKKREIEKEFRQQIHKLKTAGLTISHLDSHQHIHLFPGIFKIVLALAREYQIPRMRLPMIPLNRDFFLSRAGHSRKIFQLLINLFCIFYKPILKKNDIEFCDYGFGFLESGRMLDDTFIGIISGLKGNSCELFLHPAKVDDELKKTIGHWKYNWDEELKILTSQGTKDILHSRKIKPAHTKIRLRDVLRAYQDNSFFTKLHVGIRFITCPFLKIEEFIPLSGVILDYGCGHGLFAHLLRASSGERLVYGFDISRDKIKQANKTQIKEKKIIFFDDPDNLAALLKRVDCVALLDVLCYLPDRDRKELLENFSRQLNVGATLLVKDIAKSFSLKYLYTYLQEFICVKLLKVTRAKTLNFFESKSLFKLLQNIGFAVEEKDLSQGYLYPHTLFVCRKS